MKKLWILAALAISAINPAYSQQQILWGYSAGPSSQIKYKFGTGLTWFTLAAPCAVSQWYNGTDANAQLTCTQPAFSNISGQIALSQLPTLATNTLLGNPTGVSATPIEITLDSTLSFYSGTTLGAAQMGSLTVKSNITGVAATPADNPLTAIIDASMSSTRGSILERGASNWGAVTPGTSKAPWVSNGAGADPAYQALDLSSSVAVGSSVLNPVNGGTGVASPTAGYVKANGASPFTTSPTIPTGDIAGQFNNYAYRFGSFDICQRCSIANPVAIGASTTAYANDGWYLITGGTQASSVTGFLSPIANESINSVKVQRNSGQTGVSGMIYAAPLDNAELIPLRGQFVTLSFTMKAGANYSGGNMTATLYCGTGASPAKRGATPYTGETTVLNVVTAITTTATRYQATSAAVVPTNCSQMEIGFFWVPSGTAGADDSFTVDSLQLEVVRDASSVATPFRYVPFEQQALAAQRFLPSFTSASTTGGLGIGQAYAAGSALVFIPFRTTTRALVTGVTVSSGAHFSAFSASAAGSAAFTTAAINNPNYWGSGLNLTGGSGLVAGNASMIIFNSASGVLLFTGAEI